MAECKVHHKYVTRSELHFYQLASIHGLAPRIVEWEELEYPESNGRCFSMYTEQYSHTIAAYAKSGGGMLCSIVKRAKRMLHELHALDILHMDVNSLNILYDEPTDRVAFIDFEMSVHLSEILRDRHELCISIDHSLHIDVASIPRDGLTSRDIEYLMLIEVLREETNVVTDSKSHTPFIVQLELGIFDRIASRYMRN